MVLTLAIRTQLASPSNQRWPSTSIFMGTRRAFTLRSPVRTSSGRLSRYACATGARAAYVANILPTQGTHFTLGTCRVTCLASDTAPVAEATGSNPGGAVGTPYPNNVALCVSGKITRRYRGGHPRFYWGGLLAGNQIDARHWGTTFISNQTTFFNTFINAVKAITSGTMTGVNFVVVHYYKDKQLQSVPTTDSIQSWSIDSRIDSQRRRLGRQ